MDKRNYIGDVIFRARDTFPSGLCRCEFACFCVCDFQTVPGFDRCSLSLLRHGIVPDFILVGEFIASVSPKFMWERRCWAQLNWHLCGRDSTFSCWKQPWRMFPNGNVTTCLDSIMLCFTNKPLHISSGSYLGICN